MRRALAVLVMALATLVILAAPAAAHAEVVSASPAPGDGLPQAPGAVVIKFTEPLNVKLSTIDVVDRAGRSATRGPTTPVVGDRTAMQRKLGLLRPGNYTVEWTTTSAIDGHTLKGSYSFGIGTAPLDTQHVQSSPIDSEGWLGLAGRFIAQAALALWLGTTLLAAVARRAGLTPRRLRGFQILGPGLALAGTVAAVASSALIARGSLRAVGAVLSTQSGHWRLVVITSAAAGLLLALRTVRPTPRLIGLGLAATAALGEAAAGHASATSAPVVAVASLMVHLGAVGIWVFALAAALLTRSKFLPAMRAFAPFAITAGLVVLATGVLNAALELTSIGDLTTTEYGQILSLKIVALFTMALLGVTHATWRRRPHPDADEVRRLVRSELVAANIALILAAVLVAYPNPPRADARADAQAFTTDAPLADIAGRNAVSVAAPSGPFLVGLTVFPPRPGPIEVRVQVIGVAPGDGLRNASVHATLPGHAMTTITLTSCGFACFAGHGRITGRGTWQLATRIRSNRGPIATTTSLPLPTPNSRNELERAIAAMGHLHSVRVHERLRGDQTSAPTIADYTFRAPDAFAYTIIDGAAQITIGRHQYVREHPTSRWEDQGVAPADFGPGFRWPTSYYRELWSHASAIRLVGTATIDGVPSRIVTFVRTDVTAWFRLWIGADGLVRREEMRAEGHLMDHQYRAFNTPVQIAAPPL